MHLYHAKCYPADGHQPYYDTHGYIAACCGSYVALSWDEFVNCQQGICVYISEEEHELPEETETQRYQMVQADHFIYINEMKVPKYEKRLGYDKNNKRVQRAAQDTPYASIYIANKLSEIDYTLKSATSGRADHLDYFKSQANCCAALTKHIPDILKQYKYFFVICNRDQYRNYKAFAEMLKIFGNNKLYESEWTSNSNTAGVSTLKLFIFKKEENEACA